MMMLKMMMPSVPKMPGGDDKEKKEETAESREEAKEQVRKRQKNHKIHFKNILGKNEAASDETEGEGKNRLLPETERWTERCSSQIQGKGQGLESKSIGLILLFL